MDLISHLYDFKDVINDAINGGNLYSVIDVLREAKDTAKTVYTFGNGGSHSTASHFACDLLKACGIKAICISDMIPSTYAYNNDEGAQFMFSEILDLLGDSEDVVIAFSCSGNSINIVEALSQWPFGKNVLFTGETGGHAEESADIVIKVYNDNIRIQESAHLAYCHAIVEELLNA